MTADQARAFLHAARGTWLEAMWMTMLYLGLRPGEPAALSWDDIDTEHHLIHVRKGRKRNRGTISIGMMAQRRTHPKRRSKRRFEKPKTQV